MLGKAIGTHLSKVLGTLLVIGIAGSTVSYGTFATFTATASNSGNTFSTGTLTLATVPASGSAILSLSGMKPGDSIARGISVQNSGSINGTLTLTTTSASGANLLTTGADGLTLTVDRCTTGFAGTAPETCTGGTTNVVATRAILGSALALPALNASSTHYYVVTVALPTAADNTYQNLSQNITFTWDATQVAGSAQ